MAGARPVLGGGESRGTRTHYRNPFAGPPGGSLGNDPAFIPCPVDDRLFYILDRHGRLVDAEDARSFTGGGTNAAREFREIVGRMQHAAGLAPAPAPDQIVPVGNDVGYGAAGVAERDAAIHTARALEL